MFIRAVLIALTACTVSFGAFRAEQITQVPLQRGQSISTMITDSNGNIIVSGSNFQGAFISKLDPLGNVIFTFSNFGAYPVAVAVDRNGDIYWTGVGGGSILPF